MKRDWNLAKLCGVEKKAPAPTSDTKVLSFDVEKYAQNLDPEHEALKPLGISADTLKEWKAGYVSNYQGKGARLALPIRGSEGIVAFMGMTLDPDRPRTLPSNTLIRGSLSSDTG